jgi:N-acetylglucosamine transport system permease protein
MKRKKINIVSIMKYLPLFAWLVFSIIFFGWTMLASLSTTREIFTNDLLKSGIHFENYITLFKNQNFARYFLNSVFYTFAACFGSIAVAVPAAYVLARVKFRGRNLLNNTFLSAMSIPGILIAMPLFMIFAQLNMTDSIVALIIIYICINVPFTIFFLIGFFVAIPKELEESAAIDGCGPFGTLVKVILPLAQPGIITISIFNFIGVWNDYFFALIFVNDPENRTVALALQSVVQGFTNTGNYSGIFAACMLVFLPTFILYLIVSEKIVAGVTAGAVKG